MKKRQAPDIQSFIILLKIFLSLTVMAPVGVFAQKSIARGNPRAEVVIKNPSSDSESRAKALADSLREQQIRSAKSLLREKDSLSQLDSMRIAALADALSNVKSTDSTRIKMIQGKLDSISRAESVRKEKTIVEITALRKTITGYPVTIGGDTLFFVYVKLGAFTPQERALAISKRLKVLGDAMAFAQDSLASFQSESGVDIMYGQTTMMSVTDRDALWHTISVDTLAGRYELKMRGGIIKYRKEHSLISIIVNIARILAILLAAGAFIFMIRKVFNRVRKRIDSGKVKLTKGIHVKNVTLISEHVQRRLVFQGLFFAEIAAYLIIGYIALPFLFGVFPWTREISVVLIGWIVSPLKTLGIDTLKFIPKLFNIAIIIFITRILIKIAKKIFDEIEKGSLKLQWFYDDWAKPTFNIVRFILYVMAFVMIFPFLPGSNSPVFRGVSVFLGLLLSLGSTSAIGNIVAGLVITYMRPFKVGDRIKIGEVVGDVVEKNMLITRIRTIKNEMTTLPNSIILSGHTVNFSINDKNFSVILHTTVTIGYDAPWRKVHKLLIDAALKTTGVSKEIQPFVLQKSLDDFYVTYEVNAYTEKPQQMVLIYSELHQNIQDNFNNAGIEILSPHFRAMRDGNQSTASADNSQEATI